MGFVLYTTYSHDTCIERLRQKADIRKPFTVWLRPPKNNVMGWASGPRIHLSLTKYRYVKNAPELDAWLISDAKRGGTTIRYGYNAMPWWVYLFFGSFGAFACLGIVIDHFMNGTELDWYIFVAILIQCLLVLVVANLLYSVVGKIIGLFFKSDQAALLEFLKTTLDASLMCDK